MKNLKSISKSSKVDLFLFAIFFTFSLLIMSKTFKVSPNGNLLIATKVWSDFAATIPLIRSFSFGFNFPPEYPIFSGEPIKYHFVFFLLVGMLEKVGLNLALSLNLLSSIAFSSLLFLIYFFGKTVFNRSVGLLSVILFLFNGSLSFITYFAINPITLNTPYEIFSNTDFVTFGPYDGSIISAFWSLNIFTNQRHLALAYAIFLGLLLFLYKKSSKGDLSIKSSIILGVSIGFLPFVHLAVYGMIGLLLATLFIIYPKLRRQVFIVSILALIIAIPQFIYMGASANTMKIFNPGYLIERLTLSNFTEYWFLNLGFLVFFFPLGLWFSSKSQRKLVVPFIILFIFGFTFQLSVEAAGNHKFFNLFVIGANFFVAFSLYHLWHRNLLGKIFVPFFMLALTLSGIIDFFPIINDRYIEVADGTNNPTSKFISENTPKDSVILNGSYLYDPASMAGRKIYMGWPYFSWGAGYDTNGRLIKIKDMLNPVSVDQVCSLLKGENIDYIEIQNPSPLEDVYVNYSFFDKNFAIIFDDPVNKISIYDVKASCK